MRSAQEPQFLIKNWSVDGRRVKTLFQSCRIWVFNKPEVNSASCEPFDRLHQSGKCVYLNRCDKHQTVIWTQSRPMSRHRSQRCCCFIHFYSRRKELCKSRFFFFLTPPLSDVTEFWTSMYLFASVRLCILNWNFFYWIIKKQRLWFTITSCLVSISETMDKVSIRFSKTCYTPASFTVNWRKKYTFCGLMLSFCFCIKILSELCSFSNINKWNRTLPLSC